MERPMQLAQTFSQDLRSGAGAHPGRIRRMRLAAILASLAAVLPLKSFAAINFVYHERTGTDVPQGAPNTCVGAVPYVTILSPTASQAHELRFKVEYQFDTDRLRVYYTTDGSSPSGAFGVASGATLVVSGAYECTFTFGGNTIDIAKAAIPAQPAGTVVKYIVSAWHSGGGPEIFANSGTCGGCPLADDSSEATVFQYTVPSLGIATEPMGQTVECGGTAMFSVVASGTAPFSYQWRHAGTNLPGATSSTLTISPVSLDHAGNYDVVVTNAAGATNSAVVVLTVQETIATGPANLVLCPGATALFCVTAAGSGPFAYQWFKGVNPMAGETNNCVALTNVSAASADQYCVKVTGACNSVTNCASLTVLTNTTATALASIANACVGTVASFSTMASGTGPLSYRWTKDGVGILGETGASLSFTVTSTSGGNYCVEVTVAGVPVLSQQPQNQLTPMGNGAVFSVTASGQTVPVSLGYQWQSNGVAVAGASGSSLAVSNVTLANNGDGYRVVVSNCAGSVTSTVALLTVTPIVGISFDFDTPLQFTNAPYYLTWNNWINGAFLTPPGMFESPIGGVGPLPGGGCLDLIPNNGSENSSVLLPVSYDFSLPGKTLFASTLFKCKNPVSNSRSTQFGFVSATNSGVNDVAGQGFTTVILQSTAQPAPTYELRHQRRTSGGGLQESTLSGTATLTVSNWYRLSIALTNLKTTLNPSNYAVSATLQNMGPLGTTPGGDVLNFTTTTNNADIVNFKNVYLALRGFENTGVEYRDNTYAWTTPGNVFFVQPPQNLTLAQGRRGMFRALVDGEGPYSYQWQRSDGGPFTDIAGARSWNYLVPSARTSDNGSQYRVVVTGPANSITSDSATLTVVPEALSVVSVGSVDGTTVGVQFSQPVQAAGAENVANYTINGVAPKHARVFRTSLGALGPEGIYVVLAPQTVLSGPYTVVASGVQDLSGGAIGAGNSATGLVENLTGFDVNPLVTAPAGENYSFGPGQFIVSGGGADIFGVADQFRYVYTTRTGDFDVVAQIPYMDSVRFVSKAAILARPSLEPFSPMVMAGFNPGPIAEGSGTLRQFTEGNVRQFWNVGAAAYGANTRLFPPDVWVRLRRSGNTFLRYSSANGVNWVFDGQVSMTTPFPGAIYAGLAVCAVRNTQMESAQFENFREFAGYPGAVIAISSQPTNMTLAAGGSTNNGLVATLTGGGAPAAAGELSYQWQRDDGSGNWTNLVSSGATNNTVTIGPLFRSDHGAQFRCVVRAPGAADMTSAVFTATVTDTTAPMLASANAAVLPSYPVSEVLLSFSEIFFNETATNAANYLATNAAGMQLTVLSATFLGGDPRVIVLRVNGPLGTGTASVAISGVRDLNNNAIATTVRTFRSYPPSAGPVVVEVYQDIGNATAISGLTGHALYTAGTPTFICYSNLFGFNVGFGGIQDNYGIKAYTWFVPPTNGAYKFWLRSDESGQLFMNTNTVDSTNPAGRVLIAENTASNATYSVGTTT